MILDRRSIWPRAVAAAVALAALGGCNMLRASTPEGVEHMLLEDKDGGPMYATLKRTYPQEFDGLTREIANRSREFQGNQAIIAAAKSFILAAMARHVGEMAQAPHDALSAYRHAEIALVSAVRTADVARCATYFRSGVIDFPLPPTAVHDAMLDFEVKSWEGFAAGRDKPVGRTVTQPQRATADAIAKSIMASGVDQTTYTAAVTGGVVSDDQRCTVGLGMLRAVDALPVDEADNFTAYLATKVGEAKR